MRTADTFTRRSLLAGAAGLGFASTALGKKQKIPIGLELYSVRDILGKDLNGTVTAVAKMGYQCVEFYSPYFSWSMDQAKDVRKLLDDLGIKCLSTHNGSNAFTGDGVKKAIDLNSTIGSTTIVLASPGMRTETLDDWKKVAEMLTKNPHDNTRFNPCVLVNQEIPETGHPFLTAIESQK